MRRRLLWILAVALVAVAAVLLLRRDPNRFAGLDPEVNTEGHFVSDSLGVALMLPSTGGWSFRRDAAVPGAPYITAVHESERASAQLFVEPRLPTTTLEGVVRQRRFQLASYFGADSLVQVVGRVMQEEIRDVDGHPTMQWQAVTHPMNMQGVTARIMFMWMATLRPGNSYECIAMLTIPTDLLPEEQREYDALIQDVAFIMQSFRIR